MYLMPNPDRKVLLRDPRSMVALPSYGGNVPNTSYWRRRKKDGDGLKTTKEEVAKGQAEAKKKSDAEAKEKAKAEAENATEKFKAQAKAKADADAKEAKPTRAAKTTGSRS